MKFRRHSSGSSKQDRSGQPDRESRRVRAIIEACEPRTLMTGVTVLPAVTFSGSDGQDPLGTLVADAHGNLYGTTNGGGANSKGTVFEIPAGGSSIVPLASFDSTNGWNVHSGLVVDAQGNLYGVAGQGGDNNDGSVFEVAAGSNTITKLASFNGTNGSNPWGSIALDEQGNIWGTTLGGGANGAGAVFKFDTGTDTLTTVASFSFGSSIGARPQSGLVMDSQGNLYGTTEDGVSGAFMSGGIYELPSGSTTLQLVVTLPNPGPFPDTTFVTVDQSGNIFGTCEMAGSNYDGCVFEVPAGSNTLNTLASFDFSANGAEPMGVVVDAAGNVFGVTNSGGANYHGTVFEIANGSGTITNLADVDSSGVYFSDTPPTLVGNTLYAIGLNDNVGNNDGGVYAIQDLPMAHLAVTTQPANALTQATLSPIAVTLEDASGNAITSPQQTITASIASGPNGATLSGTPQVSSQNGVATFSDLSLDTAGTYTLDFTNGYGIVASSSFTISVPPTADHLAILQQPSSGTATQTLGTLQVEVEDSSGNVMSGDTSSVTLAIDNGSNGATLGGTVTVAAQNGVATFSDLSLSAAGSYTLTATDNSLTPATTSSIQIAALPTPPAPPVPPTPVPPPPPPALTIQAGAKPHQTVLDVSSLPISNHQKATLTVIDAPAGAHMGTVKATVNSGQVNLQNLKMNMAGTYTVQVTDPTSNQVQTQQVVVTPGKATRLVFSRQPVNTKVGTQFGVQVEAVDRFGNVVTDDSSIVTLRRTWRTDGPTLGGTLSVAMVNGVADFSDLTLNAKDPFELTAIDAAEGLKVDSRVFLVN